MKKRMPITLILLPLAVCTVSLFIGRYPISPKQVIHTLSALLTGQLEQAGAEFSAVIFQLRLPRVLAAAFVGAGLSASGAAFQGVFHNPLVSAGLLGVSAGAGFGAALAIFLFSATWITYPFAFLFGMAAMLLSYWTARIYKTVPTIMLVLGGTVISAIFNALISVLKYVADTERQLPAIVYWLMGSLSSVGYRDFWALIPIVMGLLLLLLMGWRINVLSMGDKEARTMGVDVKKIKTIVIISATLATAGAVCLSGVVSWVGLVVPHIGRMLAGNDNRRLLPLSMSLGAAFLVAMDTVSRTLIESEIPLGILTALVGAPFFIFLLKKTRGGGWR